jgi:hypothetical protein
MPKQSIPIYWCGFFGDAAASLWAFVAKPLHPHINRTSSEATALRATAHHQRFGTVRQNIPPGRKCNNVKHRASVRLPETFTSFILSLQPVKVRRRKNPFARWPVLRSTRERPDVFHTRSPPAGARCCRKDHGVSPRATIGRAEKKGRTDHT